MNKSLVPLYFTHLQLEFKQEHIILMRQDWTRRINRRIGEDPMGSSHPLKFWTISKNYFLRPWLNPINSYWIFSLFWCLLNTEASRDFCHLRSTFLFFKKFLFLLRFTTFFSVLRVLFQLFTYKNIFVFLIIFLLVSWMLTI